MPARVTLFGSADSALWVSIPTIGTIDPRGASPVHALLQMNLNDAAIGQSREEHRSDGLIWRLSRKSRLERRGRQSL